MNVKALHRVMKSLLNDLRFKCSYSTCTVVNYYEEALKHIYDFPKNSVDCV